MRGLIQRVSQAKVAVDGRVIGAIGPGILLFVGIAQTDTKAQASALAGKVLGLRIFPDADKPMDRSLEDIHGELLVVSQFTLYGDCGKGRRPSFTQAAPSEIAEALYEEVITCAQDCGIKVATGQFGAMMQVSLTNDGPVTFMLEI